MARGVDLSGLSPAERIVAASGSVLFLNGFVPWWYRIRTPRHTYLHNAGLTGWGLLAVLAGFAATCAVVVRTMRRPAPQGDHALYTGLGVVALASLIYQGRQSAVTWIGVWVAEAAALAIVVGGVRRWRERKGGWV